MKVATDGHKPKWRNALAWAAIGFLLYGFTMLAGITLLHHGGLAAVFKSRETDAILLLALLVATGMAGLGQRNLAVNQRNFRNLLIWTWTSVGIFALVMWGLGTFVGRPWLKAMSVSATIALWVGLVLFFLAILGLLHVMAARTRTQLLTEEQSEAILERIRALSYGLLGVAAMGLTLVALSLVGPGGPLPRGIALASVLILLVIRVVLSFAIRPMLDELSKTVSRETGYGAFYLIVVIGGGWAILAQLHFAAAPAPLDWLTMLTLAMFAASFIAAGRRGLLSAS